MNKILEINNVTKYYGSGSVVTKALNGISFSVEKGEFTAIMGASGSGKSTLLNVIATIDRVSSGDISVRGRHLTEMKEDALSAFRRDHLGFIFQGYNLLDTLTVGENIALPLNLKKVGPVKTRKEVRRVAEALGVANQALVLADEPTGALDSKNSKRLMQTFQMMNQSLGSTILMVTHDPVVGSYADRVLFLKDGRIWSEADRGNRSRQDMYRDILSVTAALGGESDVI